MATATFNMRWGDISNAPKPSRIRSMARSFGAFLRDRFRIRSGCFRRRDSAMTVVGGVRKFVTQSPSAAELQFAMDRFGDRRGRSGRAEVPNVS